MTDRAGEAGNTMSVLHNQTLDPRLRRLVHTMHDPSRMRRDLDQAVVSATTELAADEVVLPSVLTTRVLVRSGSPSHSPRSLTPAGSS